MGAARVTQARLKAGIYQLEVTAAGFVSHKLTLQLLPGTRVTRSIQLERKGRSVARAKPRTPPRKPKTPPNPGALRKPLIGTCVALGGTALVIGVALMASSGGILGEATKMQGEETGPPALYKPRSSMRASTAAERSKARGLRCLSSPVSLGLARCSSGSGALHYPRSYNRHPKRLTQLLHPASLRLLCRPQLQMSDGNSPCLKRTL